MAISSILPMLSVERYMLLEFALNTCLIDGKEKGYNVAGWEVDHLFPSNSVAVASP